MNFEVVVPVAWGGIISEYEQPNDQTTTRLYYRWWWSWSFNMWVGRLSTTKLLAYPRNVVRRDLPPVVNGKPARLTKFLARQNRGFPHREADRLAWTFG